MKKWLCALALAFTGGQAGADDGLSLLDSPAARTLYAEGLNEKRGVFFFKAAGRELRALEITWPADGYGDLDAISTATACDLFLLFGELDQYRAFGFTVVRLRGNAKDHHCAL